MRDVAADVNAVEQAGARAQFSAAAPSDQTVSTNTKAENVHACSAVPMQEPRPSQRKVCSADDGCSSVLTTDELEQRLRQVAFILATGVIRAALRCQQEAQLPGKDASCESENSARAMSTKRTSTPGKSHHGAVALDPEQLTAPDLYHRQHSLRA
jgi:hypothetical protein